MTVIVPGFSVHGILQARILEWVAISFSRGSSRPRDQTWVSHWATMEGMDCKFGISRCKLLYIEWINNTHRKYVQYPIISHNVNHLSIHQKLTQHCKSTILQCKINLKHFFFFTPSEFQISVRDKITLLRHLGKQKFKFHLSSRVWLQPTGIIKIHSKMVYAKKGKYIIISGKVGKWLIMWHYSW